MKRTLLLFSVLILSALFVIPSVTLAAEPAAETLQQASATVPIALIAVLATALLGTAVVTGMLWRHQGEETASS